MSNYVVLSPTVHKKVKVITQRSADYGDAVKYAMTFPLEFRNIQACYPIFFSKSNETGEFFPSHYLDLKIKKTFFLETMAGMPHIFR